MRAVSSTFSASGLREPSNITEVKPAVDGDAALLGV
jgi:hypothetical protein